MADFPIESLRHFLLPNQLLSVKFFSEKTLHDLEKQINDWVSKTKSIIVYVGIPNNGNDTITIAITFVPAVES